MKRVVKREAGGGVAREQRGRACPASSLVFCGCGGGEQQSDMCRQGASASAVAGHEALVQQEISSVGLASRESEWWSRAILGVHARRNFGGQGGWRPPPVVPHAT